MLRTFGLAKGRPSWEDKEFFAGGSWSTAVCIWKSLLVLFEAHDNEVDATSEIPWALGFCQTLRPQQTNLRIETQELPHDLEHATVVDHRKTKLQPKKTQKQIFNFLKMSQVKHGKTLVFPAALQSRRLGMSRMCRWLPYGCCGAWSCRCELKESSRSSCCFLVIFQKMFFFYCFFQYM